MEFEIRQDIAAPIDAVFAAVTDFSAFERQVLRRGAELRRLDQPQRHGAGAAWDAAFQFRGRDRRVTIEVTEMDAPNGLRFSGDSQGVRFDGGVELIALARAHTRMTLSLSVAPKTLSARLLVQSLKLARGSINRRIGARVEQFARDVELRHSRTAPPRGR